MSTNNILKRIGGKLREDSRDIVDVELPETVRALLRRLSCQDTDSDTMATTGRMSERS